MERIRLDFSCNGHKVIELKMIHSENRGNKIKYFFTLLCHIFHINILFWHQHYWFSPIIWHHAGRSKTLHNCDRSFNKPHSVCLVWSFYDDLISACLLFHYCKTTVATWWRITSQLSKAPDSYDQAEQLYSGAQTGPPENTGNALFTGVTLWHQRWLRGIKTCWAMLWLCTSIFRTFSWNVLQKLQKQELI